MVVIKMPGQKGRTQILVCLRVEGWLGREDMFYLFMLQDMWEPNNVKNTVGQLGMKLVAIGVKNPVSEMYLLRFTYTARICLNSNRCNTYCAITFSPLCFFLQIKDIHPAMRTSSMWLLIHFNVNTLFTNHFYLPAVKWYV